MTRLALPGLATRSLGRVCLQFDELDSTNTYGRAHAAGLPDGTAILARRQTRGKGRLGRDWAKEQTDDGLALSVVLRRPDHTGAATLPLGIGLAVSGALESLCGAPFPIKWPNDVLLRDKKICGILCEAFQTDQSVFFVCGIGVNLRQTQADFDALGLPHATSLRIGAGCDVSTQVVAAAILNELEPLLRRFWKDGFGALADAYTARCITVGREVRLLTGTREARGQALAVEADGTLSVRMPDGVRRINAGEVSVRGIYGYV